MRIMCWRCETNILYFVTRTKMETVGVHRVVKLSTKRADLLCAEGVQYAVHYTLQI